MDKIFYPIPNFSYHQLIRLRAHWWFGLVVWWSAGGASHLPSTRSRGSTPTSHHQSTQPISRIEADVFSCPKKDACAVLGCGSKKNVPKWLALVSGDMDVFCGPVPGTLSDISGHGHGSQVLQAQKARVWVFSSGCMGTRFFWVAPCHPVPELFSFFFFCLTFFSGDGHFTY